MDWFKRYGIPGAYFYGLTLAWLYVLYPCVISDNTNVFFALATITFLPIGYLITNFQYSLYLKCRCKGLLRKAKEKARKEGKKIPSLFFVNATMKPLLRLDGLL